MSAFDFDLFVIGAGSGGVRAARIAASLGARVGVAEGFRIGGTCVIRGCVPKKLYVLASRCRDDFDSSRGFGWSYNSLAFDWRRLVDAKEREITRLSGIYETNLDKAGVKIFRARAKLAGARSTGAQVVLSNGEEIFAERVLIATGGAPAALKIPGAHYAISSNEIFDLPHLPQRLLILGSGYIAVEFASAFKRFGCDVTLAFRADKVLRGFDEEIRARLSEALSASGVKLASGARPVKIEKIANGFCVFFDDGTRREADQILMATGRAPATQDLGLEAAGVALDEQGAIIVDDAACSSNPAVFAVGDVTNRVNLTPVAIREGHAFADRIYGGEAVKIDYEAIPTGVFTTPELGTIGLTEEEALRQTPTLDIYSADFRPMKASFSGSGERMFMKLVVDAHSNIVLGAHILGENAAEMAQLLAISIRMGVKKSDFDATMALHPSSAEELVTMRAPTRRRQRD